mmetsp:Transcript_67730/g.218843  ORF Transcript_67730/g.218843 Transcript_67730/m.218843 type:complete len:257 (+) Transcript_67730:244-1014(+)
MHGHHGRDEAVAPEALPRVVHAHHVVRDVLDVLGQVLEALPRLQPRGLQLLPRVPEAARKAPDVVRARGLLRPDPLQELPDVLAAVLHLVLHGLPELRRLALAAGPRLLHVVPQLREVVSDRVAEALQLRLALGLLLGQMLLALLDLPPEPAHLLLAQLLLRVQRGLQLPDLGLQGPEHAPGALERVRAVHGVRHGGRDGRRDARDAAHHAKHHGGGRRRPLFGGLDCQRRELRHGPPPTQGGKSGRCWTSKGAGP